MSIVRFVNDNVPARGGQYKEKTIAQQAHELVQIRKDDEGASCTVSLPFILLLASSADGERTQGQDDYILEYFDSSQHALLLCSSLPTGIRVGVVI